MAVSRPNGIAGVDMPTQRPAGGSYQSPAWQWLGLLCRNRWLDVDRARGWINCAAPWSKGVANSRFPICPRCEACNQGGVGRQTIGNHYREPHLCSRTQDEPRVLPWLCIYVPTAMPELDGLVWRWPAGQRCSALTNEADIMTVIAGTLTKLHTGRRAGFCGEIGHSRLSMPVCTR